MLWFHCNVGLKNTLLPFVSETIALSFGATADIEINNGSDETKYIRNIRSRFAIVQRWNPFFPEDIAACHHLPSANMNKPVVVKLKYNHQRDRILRKRASLKNYGPTKKVCFVKRLADHDKQVIEHCKQVNVEYVTNNCQPMVRVEGVLKKVDSKNNVDMILHNGSVDKDVQMHVYSGSTQGDSFVGSK